MDWLSEHQTCANVLFGLTAMDFFKYIYIYNGLTGTGQSVAQLTRAWPNHTTETLASRRCQMCHDDGHVCHGGAIISSL